MNNYLISDGDFVHVTKHNDPVVVQDNPITHKFISTAMTNYLDSLSFPPVAPDFIEIPTA